ncbi:hypothetical protein OK074_3734 [Actinobacteria bacterium OK074]|nr:hypothetical protein OK074_3734 [Actinobacteria bacterium OK074]
MLGTAITGLVALIGVALGGWLSLRNQDRMWKRDHERHWRDIRLRTYNDFLTALRRYVAFVNEANVQVTAVAHPRVPGEQLPSFDSEGRPYKEDLEAALMAVRLVSSRLETVRACIAVVAAARQVAAARATVPAGEVPAELFETLWTAEHELLNAARAEVELPALPDMRRG